jgi:hypothetical protein
MQKLEFAPTSASCDWLLGMGREAVGAQMAMTLRNNKTKIVASIGPASNSPEMLASLIRAGMNIARLNLWHGSFDEHAEIVTRIRTASKTIGLRIIRFVLLSVRAKVVTSNKHVTVGPGIEPFRQRWGCIMASNVAPRAMWLTSHHYVMLAGFVAT